MEPAEPGVFEIVCSSGARGQCVRFGYFPWVSGAMRDIYDACIRMVRADYCGDGAGTTGDGMRIDLYDDRDIQKADGDSTQEYEAGWTAAGAVCVHHVRVKENILLESLAASCPRLHDRLGATCTEARPRALGATLFVRSLPGKVGAQFGLGAGAATQPTQGEPLCRGRDEMTAVIAIDI